MDKRKIIKVRTLLMQVDNYLIDTFFDIDSTKLLDEKIEVLTKLSEGVAPADIPNFYDILELYPKDDIIWD